MSNEEFERKMEFIVGEQAKSVARLAHLEEIVTRLADATLNRIDDVDEKIAALIDSQIRHDRRFEEVDEKIAMLVDSQVRTEENLTRTEENVRRTEENVRKTDESLRNLMEVVDRYFREGRNGKSND